MIAGDHRHLNSAPPSWPVAVHSPTPKNASCSASCANSVREISPQSVAAIRAKLKLSQAQFARAFGISLDTLQNWEQGRRQPTGPAKVLLRVAERHPEAVLEAVA